MTDKQEHSPLPTLWSEGCAVVCHDPFSPDCDPDGNQIDNRIQVGGFPTEEMAEYVVTAVNSHAALVKACRLHQAWSDSERAGPDYGGQSRDTHPDGEKIWQRWWDNQLDLCDRATEATRAALAALQGDTP